MAKEDKKKCESKEETQKNCFAVHEPISTPQFPKTIVTPFLDLRTNLFQDEGNDMITVELQKVIEELMILMIKAEEDKLDFNENWPVASKLALIRP